ncbi:MAG: hypothetical protein JWP36_1024 [Paucimonas sp.]|nr:hypothetical protein [Paucimonas sp.]
MSISIKDGATPVAALHLAPFDESLALQGHALMTAQGHAARLVAIDETAPPAFQLRVWVEGQPVVRSYCRDGRFRADGQADNWDLYLCKASLGQDASRQPRCQPVAHAHDAMSAA